MEEQRKPGRPRTSMKKLVSMRLDVAVWGRLGKAKQAGKIRSREQFVNDLLREKVAALRQLMGVDTGTKNEH